MGHSVRWRFGDLQVFDSAMTWGTRFCGWFGDDGFQFGDVAADDFEVGAVVVRGRW